MMPFLTSPSLSTETRTAASTSTSSWRPSASRTRRAGWKEAAACSWAPTPTSPSWTRIPMFEQRLETGRTEAAPILGQTSRQRDVRRWSQRKLLYWRVLRRGRRVTLPRITGDWKVEQSGHPTANVLFPFSSVLCTMWMCDSHYLWSSSLQSVK